MSWRFHVPFVVGLLAWVTVGVLYPTWDASLYYPDHPDIPERWNRGGAFGFGELSRCSARSPIWRPPVSTTSIEANVRWPWQAPSQRAHFDISIMTFANWVTLGLILFGFVGWFATQLFPPLKPDRFLVLASTLSLGLIVARVLGVLLMVFSLGYAPDSFHYFLMFVGGVGGLVAGGVWLVREREERVAIVFPVEAAGPPVVVAVAVEGSQSVGMGMLSFTLGILASSLLLLVGFVFAGAFRGPVTGYSTLMTPEYGPIPVSVYRITGGAIAVVGWIIGLWLYRSLFRRAFGVGVITAATLFGILFAVWR